MATPRNVIGTFLNSWLLDTGDRIAKHRKDSVASNPADAERMKDAQLRADGAVRRIGHGEVLKPFQVARDLGLIGADIPAGERDVFAFDADGCPYLPPSVVTEELESRMAIDKSRGSIPSPQLITRSADGKIATVEFVDGNSFSARLGHIAEVSDEKKPTRTSRRIIHDGPAMRFDTAAAAVSAVYEQMDIRPEAERTKSLDQILEGIDRLEIESDVDQVAR